MPLSIAFAAPQEQSSEPGSTAQNPPPAQNQNPAKLVPAAENSDGLGDLLDGLDLQNPPDDVPTIPDASRASEPENLSGRGFNTQPPNASQDSISTLFEAFQSMQKAEQLLARGQTDQDVVAAQKRAVELLDALLKSLPQNSPSGSQSQSQQDQQPQSQDQQQADMQAQPNQRQSSQPQNGPEEEGSSQNASASNQPGGEGDASKEQPLPATASAAALNAVGKGVWGHLPQKTRGMLRSDIPTDYLPGYSKQISEYFKALAEMPSDQ